MTKILRRYVVIHSFFLSCSPTTTMTIIQKVKVKGTQPCSTLCETMDYSLPGSSVHGIL